MGTGQTGTTGKKAARRRPLFQVIAADLKGKIASGELGSAARLPTEADLSGEYTTTRPTVRKGLQCLIDAGLIEARGKLGYFVRETREIHWRLSSSAKADMLVDPWAALADADTPPLRRRQTVTVRIDRANKVIRGRSLTSMLALTDDALVVCHSATRYIGEDAVELNDSYVPYALALDQGQASPLMAETDQPVMDLIKETGRRVTGFTDTMTARIPTDAEAARLELPAVTPVVELLRRVRFEDGRCLLVVHTVLRGDGAEFEHDVRT